MRVRDLIWMISDVSEDFRQHNSESHSYEQALNAGDNLLGGKVFGQLRIVAAVGCVLRGQAISRLGDYPEL